MRAAHMFSFSEIRRRRFLFSAQCAFHATLCSFQRSVLIQQHCVHSGTLLIFRISSRTLLNFSTQWFVVFRNHVVMNPEFHKYMIMVVMLMHGDDGGI
jgi:predicted membrane GTPase involved in stress response